VLFLAALDEARIRTLSVEAGRASVRDWSESDNSRLFKSLFDKRATRVAGGGCEALSFELSCKRSSTSNLAVFSSDVLLGGKEVLSLGESVGEG